MFSKTVKSHKVFMQTSVILLLDIRVRMNFLTGQASCSEVFAVHAMKAYVGCINITPFVVNLFIR